MMKQHHRRGALVLIVTPLLALLIGLAMSPAVRVNHITVVAPDLSLGQEVQRQLRVPADASGFFYPLNHITEQARGCYRVKDVSTERVSPYEIRVTVTAREPFAALDDGDGFTIISRDGVCLYRKAVSEKLPVLLGMAVPRPPLGSTLPPEKLLWVCELLAGATKVNLQSELHVDLRQPLHIVVKTADGLTGVLGNVNNLTRKMTIVGRTAEQLRSEGKIPVRIDVSLPEAPAWTVK
ncbi:MAG: hypothetical protein WCP21_07080 [Armatimonadota bacterium]